MRTQTLVIVLTVLALLLGGSFLMHGHGRSHMPKWLTAIHGR